MAPSPLSEETIVGALKELQKFAIERAEAPDRDRAQALYRIIDKGFTHLLARASSDEIRIRLSDLWQQAVEHRPYELAERLHATFAIFLATARPNAHGRVIAEIHWELTRPGGAPKLVSIQGGKQ